MGRTVTPRILCIVGVVLATVCALLLSGYWHFLGCANPVTDPALIKYIDLILRNVIFPVGILLSLGIFFVVVGLVFSGANSWTTPSLKIIVFILIVVCTSIVLSSISTARSRSPVAAIKTYLSHSRASVADYFDLYKNYGKKASSCTEPYSMFMQSPIKESIAEVEKQSKFSVECFSDGERYAMAVPLAPWLIKKQGVLCPLQQVDHSNLEHFCVDSTGFAGIMQGPITSPVCR